MEDVTIRTLGKLIKRRSNLTPLTKRSHIIITTATSTDNKNKSLACQLTRNEKVCAKTSCSGKQSFVTSQMELILLTGD